MWKPWLSALWSHPATTPVWQWRSTSAAASRNLSVRWTSGQQVLAWKTPISWTAAAWQTLPTITPLPGTSPWWAGSWSLNIPKYWNIPPSGWKISLTSPDRAPRNSAWPTLTSFFEATRVVSASKPEAPALPNTVYPQLPPETASLLFP